MVVATEADPVLTRLVDADKVPWYKKKNLRNLYLLLFPTCMGIEITSGFDSQLINSLQGVDSWKNYFGDCQKVMVKKKMETVCFSSSLTGIIGACYALGAICSLPFVPMFNQRFGRRWSIFFGSAVSIFGAVLQGASQNLPMYIIARMILGFGIPFCIIAGSAMLGELSYPKERPFMTALFNASYFIGSLTAAGITMRTALMKDNGKSSDLAWRIPSYLQLVPSMVQLLLVFFLPESPRYLVSKDRREDAFKILAHYHSEGDQNSLFVKAEIAQIETTIKMEMDASKQTYLDLFRTAGMRRRALLAVAIGFFTQWSGNTLISYYFLRVLDMLGVKNSHTKQVINVGYTAWGLVNATSIALVVTRFPRRRMFLVCTLGMFACYFGWTICMGLYLEGGSVNRAAGIMAIFFIFAYSPMYNVGYNSLTYTYLVEIFPYAERTRGLAFFQFWSRGANFFSTFVNPIGLEAITWKYLIVFVVWVLFESFVVYFLFPETYNRTLEELSFIYEGQEVQNQQSMATEKYIQAQEFEVGYDGRELPTDRPAPIEMVDVAQPEAPQATAQATTTESKKIN
ncbi:related to transporter (major facilitator superfamily) [Rhynchosporium secalis]|uniref:Related to transporter (Major facilitator superfamily) n=1 Tax=Rhynchosporium secalis TaxID=38038 RepID=A0A1E1MKV0_RHYSE|nr:related to transporter (major facilitator superfamily) [Rhynchosporium secalis]